MAEGKRLVRLLLQPTDATGVEAYHFLGLNLGPFIPFPSLPLLGSILLGTYAHSTAETMINLNPIFKLACGDTNHELAPKQTSLSGCIRH